MKGTVNARRAIAATLAAMSVSVWFSDEATAVGGAAIAGAPTAKVATTLDGNTSSDDVNRAGAELGPGPVCPGDGEFWLASLTRGDRVTIKGSGLAPAAQMYVDIFPPGTTDGNLSEAKPLVSAPLVMLELTAPDSGVYPILIGTSPQCGGVDGPFNFALFVVHEALLQLPSAWIHRFALMGARETRWRAVGDLLVACAGWRGWGWCCRGRSAVRDAWFAGMRLPG